MIKIRTMAKSFAPFEGKFLVNGVLKVYRDVAPEGAKMPFLVWSMTSTSPIDSVDCAGSESDWSLQFDVYSGDWEECDNLSDITIDFINSFGRFKGYVKSPTVIGECRNTLKAFAITKT